MRAKVGYRYRVELSIDMVSSQPSAFRAEWSPTMPRKLSAAEMADYFRARDALLSEVSAALGLKVGVVDVGKSSVAMKVVEPADRGGVPS